MAGLELKYFVLNPNKKDMYGWASREAVLVYANCIETENKRLAKDLRLWVSSIRKKHERDECKKRKNLIKRFEKALLGGK